MLLAFAISALLTGAPRVVTLPAGVVVVDGETKVPAGFTVTGDPKGTVVRASDGFRGRAVFVAESNVTIRNLTIDGNRSALQVPVRIAPDDRAFVDFYDRGNGIIAREVTGLTLRDITMREIANFAVIVAASDRVSIERLAVSDSGSLKRNGRNNTSGGILLEEGTRNFSVRGCTLRNIRGNGIWTHSRYRSPQNGPGVFQSNTFDTIGRDAVQIGHAREAEVRDNVGRRIGWPVEVVDMEGGGTPVGIDTAGDVSLSVYTHNRFEEINGKCIDLDGANRTSVTDNTCVNSKSAEDYPFGHYGIVMNNTNPDMKPDEVRIRNNVIDGAKFGGIFVIGKGNVVYGNSLRRINLAHCNDTTQVNCLFDPKQPDLLRAGIYLGAGAERPAPAIDTMVVDNVVEGYGMAEHCIVIGPGVSQKQRMVESNTCRNTTP